MFVLSFHARKKTYGVHLWEARGGESHYNLCPPFVIWATKVLWRILVKESTTLLCGFPSSMVYPTVRRMDVIVRLYWRKKHTYLPPFFFLCLISPALSICMIARFLVFRPEILHFHVCYFLYVSFKSLF